METSARYRELSGYEQWMREEGLPVVTGYGADLPSVELGSWERLGGRGAFVDLAGMEGLTGIYVAEIPPGGSIAPERHLYEKLIYILSGRGVARVWTGVADAGPDGARVLEWQEGSLFAPPINTWHQLFNISGTDPVRFFAATNAPIIMDLFHNAPFISSSDYVFGDRYDGRAGYFDVAEPALERGRLQWETNFIPDLRGQIELQDGRAMGTGLRSVNYQMAGNTLVGHLAEWAPCRYGKAHHHLGGAILFIVRGQGYTLMWPSELGIRPFESGFADRVVRVNWREGSAFSPPTGWFHQHFVTGSDSSFQLAIRFGSPRHRLRFHDAQLRAGHDVSVRQGGVMIEHEDEDPEIRRLYEAALAAVGLSCAMPGP